MSAAQFAVTLVLASFATYVTRFPPLWLGRRLKVTPRIKQGLDFIPLGVFAAMVGPTVFGKVYPFTAIDSAFLVATGLSAVVAWLTKNPLWTMIVGVVAVAGIRCF